MANILIKSGWLGSNTLEWYANSGDLGDHVVGLVHHLGKRHSVVFSGDSRYKGRTFDLEVHIERQISTNRKSKKILIVCEPHFVQPQNLIFPKLNYAGVFEIDSIPSKKSNVRKYRYPRELSDEQNSLWEERDILISCINANKNAVIASNYNLYFERNDLIRRFDSKFGDQFHLYGGGWDLRDHPVGLLAKVAFRLSWLRPLLKRQKPLASYRGKCDSKAEIMQRSKFTLCVENTQYPGCMTEKMIDCFRFGSVPLYLGPPDIGDMIDPSLFVDLRQFNDREALFAFIENYSEMDYEQWRERLELHRADIRARHSVSGFIEMVCSAVEEAIARPVVA